MRVGPLQKTEVGSRFGSRTKKYYYLFQNGFLYEHVKKLESETELASFQRKIHDLRSATFWRPFEKKTIYVLRPGPLSPLILTAATENEAQAWILELSSLECQNRVEEQANSQLWKILLNPVHEIIYSSRTSPEVKLGASFRDLIPRFLPEEKKFYLMNLSSKERSMKVHVERLNCEPNFWLLTLVDN